MKRLLMIAAALILAHQAQAADLSVAVDETEDHPAAILIKGQIGDRQEIDLFSALIGYQKKAAVVFLDSLGGKVMTAIHIGLLIRKHGFSTAVADDTQCSSACAFIWMAGKQRFMGTRARIGFHAARVSLENNELASGANAVIGAYLYGLGVTDFKSIIYLTSASPQAMRWLNQRDASTYKIDVNMFSLLEPQWTWARTALDAKPREPAEVTVAAPPKVLAPVPAKKPSQTAIATRPSSPSRCDGTEAHSDNDIRCLKPKGTFRDCPDCPEMVVVPAGEFMMGSEQSNDEEPVHKVTIAKPFAAGKYEVTFDDWDACAIAGGCKHLPDDQSWGRGNRP